MVQWNKKFPEYIKFYSKLKQGNVELKEYDHGKKVWDLTNCTNGGDYNDLYLKTDVLILADCISKFRETMIKDYKIDPCWCYSSPGLTWQNGLRFITEIEPTEENPKPVRELALLSDVDMHMFFERAIRGGISSVMGLRYIKANNKYVPDYNPKERTSFIDYIDENNLYGWAMSQDIPYVDLKWVNKDIIDSMNNNLNDAVNQLMVISKDSDVGYFYCVDLYYSPEIKYKTRYFH